jgi:hypothetical protein
MTHIAWPPWRMRQAGEVAEPVRYIVVANRLLINLKSQRVYKVVTTSRSSCVAAFRPVVLCGNS